ncbi:hypothetical protein TNIN_80851 [Trichonephila inaurata madagascariensis]|uniref:Uncharacterized protein n=1 Tax=Trichonephila inaurata madagascariensis TaxID=2747483 RepID=A0A8X6X7Q8_9ARAC|nr:hypothetical protein TNIN_80851 [Trichonephila inaurata madagascariensis]
MEEKISSHNYLIIEKGYKSKTDIPNYIVTISQNPYHLTQGNLTTTDDVFNFRMRTTPDDVKIHNAKFDHVGVTRESILRHEVKRRYLTLKMDCTSHPLLSASPPK